MTTLTETRHPGGFIKSEAQGHRSRAVGLITASAAVLAGMVLGAITLGAASAQAVAGNGGNGAMGAITVGAGAKRGVYTLTIVEPAADAGEFVLEDPDGVTVGNGTVGAAFSMGGLAFTLADGTNNFVAGDQIKITVADGAGSYEPLDPAGTDGTAVAAAVAFGEVAATDADRRCTLIVRDCELVAADLTWPAGITTDQKNQAIAELRALGIILR